MHTRKCKFRLLQISIFEIHPQGFVSSIAFRFQVWMDSLEIERALGTCMCLQSSRVLLQFIAIYFDNCKWDTLIQCHSFWCFKKTCPAMWKHYLLWKQVRVSNRKSIQLPKIYLDLLNSFDPCRQRNGCYSYDTHKVDLLSKTLGIRSASNTRLFQHKCMYINIYDDAAKFYINHYGKSSFFCIT